MTPRPTLPVELHETIIGQLSDDPRALIACSLVCSDWLAPTRIRLFHDVAITYHDLDWFLEILESHLCTFARFVRSLQLVKPHLYSEPLSNVVPRLATPLEHITHLRIQDWEQTNDGSASSAFERFHRVETLQLESCDWENINDFTTLVCSFPALRYLACNRIFADYNDETINTHSQQRVLPSTITSLYFNSRRNALFHYLISQPTIHHLRLLSLSTVFCSISLACELLRITGSSLRDLIVIIPFLINDSHFFGDPSATQDLSELTLEHNTALETLHFSVNFRIRQVVTWIPNFISSCTSHHLRRLTFEIGWLTLERPRFWPKAEFLRAVMASQVQEIVFSIRNSLDQELRQALYDMMSGLGEKVVLKFERFTARRMGSDPRINVLT